MEYLTCQSQLPSEALGPRNQKSQSYLMQKEMMIPYDKKVPIKIKMLKRVLTFRFFFMIISYI